MIKKITDSDKFICKVIGITGKEVKEKEFATYEEACKYKNGMEELKNIDRVEIYTENNTPINKECDDSFEEISNAISVPKKMERKKLKMSTQTAQQLGQRFFAARDAREYIGEYIDEYFERYRGISVYKKQINNIEYEFVAEFLEKEYKAKTIEEMEEKLDKAITKYVDTYVKDFEFTKAQKEGK